MKFRVISKVRGDKRASSDGVSPDQELVRRAQKGDQEAVTLLYVKYHRKIMNYLYRFTGERGKAEELAQETFLKVVQNLHRYRPTGSVGGWIYRIAGNLGLNAVRDHPPNRELSLDEPVSLEEGSVDRKEVIPSRSPRPDEEAIRMERERAVQGALLKVASPYRTVLILCDIERHSYAEAAEMLACPINTIASRLARGRAQLAQVLGYLRKEF